MTIDYNVYLGPYVEYSLRLTVTTRLLCRRPDECPKPTSDFCPTCGLKTPIRSELVKTVDPEIDPSSLFEDVLISGFGGDDGEQDHKAKTSTVRLYPNDHRKGWPRDFFFDPREEENHAAIEPADIEAEKAWFSEAFASEIAMLREVGAIDLKVKWGIMLWQS